MITDNNRAFWNTVSFERSIVLLKRALSGELFEEIDIPEEYSELVGEKFSIDDILSAIKTHQKSLAKEYYPVNKNILKIHLDKFLLNPLSPVAMSFSFLAWWTTNPLMTRPLRALRNSKNTDFCLNLIAMFKEELSINTKNKIIRTIDLIEYDISSMVKTFSPINWKDALIKYMQENTIYPSDLVFNTFRKEFVRFYKESA